MGILDWNGTKHHVEIVTDDWLKQMHYRIWEQVWPNMAVEI
jgi:hypothetical protein